MKPLRQQNYYEILGISRYASPEEVRNAYELSKLTFTQNSVATYSLFSEEENQEILDLIYQAYETLLNPGLRQEYDHFLDHREPEQTWEDWADRHPVPPLTQRPPQTQARDAMPTAYAEHSRPPAHDEPAEEHRPDSGASEVQRYVRSLAHYDGPALQKIREMKGYSLREVGDRTKIRLAYIEYVEQENFSMLPAQIYVKGFVKLLAQTLELPVHQVVEDYMARYRNLTGKEKLPGQD